MDNRAYHRLNAYIHAAADQNDLFLINGDYMEPIACWHEAMLRNKMEGLAFDDYIEWLEGVRVRHTKNMRKNEIERLKFFTRLNAFAGQVFDWYMHDHISNAKWMIGICNNKMDYDMNILVTEDNELIRATEKEARDYWGCTDIVCYNGITYRDIDYLDDGEISDIVRYMGRERPSGYAGQYWDRCIPGQTGDIQNERQWLKSFSAKWCKDIQISF